MTRTHPGDARDGHTDTCLTLLTGFLALHSQAARKCIAVALLLSITHTATAASVIYSITSDAFVLNNPNGTWGGNLNLGAGQDINLTVAYRFAALPSSSAGTTRTFQLEGMRIYDNTNGLASAFITGTGDITITYNGVTDFQSSATYGTPGGSFHTNELLAELGDFGDPLPTGAIFDSLVESAGILRVIARAPNFEFNNISGLNGLSLDPGSFTFHSQLVPIPPAVYLFASGLLGLIGCSRRTRHFSN
ncbi:MAG: hypothetical protein R3F42_09865 [Pseudomonadota bacterium]